MGPDKPSFMLWYPGTEVEFVYEDENWVPWRWMDTEWVEMPVDPAMRARRDALLVTKDKFFEEFRASQKSDPEEPYGVSAWETAA